jgi:hypothetical protein
MNFNFLKPKTRVTEMAQGIVKSRSKKIDELKQTTDAAEARKLRELIVLGIFATDCAIFNCFGKTPEAEKLRDLIAGDSQVIMALRCGPAPKKVPRLLFDLMLRADEYGYLAASDVRPPDPPKSGDPAAWEKNLNARLKLYAEALTDPPETKLGHLYYIGRVFSMLCGEAGKPSLELEGVTYFSVAITESVKLLHRFRLVMD